MSTSLRFALRSRRVVLPCEVCEAVMVIDGEKIVELHSGNAAKRFEDAEDLGDLVISPGVIDSHVHINEPGRAHWEGFESATRSAAAGGVTTLADMPLNSAPVTTTRAALDQKQSAVHGKSWVDIGFYGGLIPGNLDQLGPLVAEGVLGIKAFLCHSGLDEFPAVLEQHLVEAMPLLTRARVPLLVHAELAHVPAPIPTNSRSYPQYVASRPDAWEVDAVALLIRLCREHRCHVHIVHLATGEALSILSAAKRAGLPITVETCPHYLFFSAEEIADGDTRFKCAPPIRPGAGLALWQGLWDGTIDTIGSDHSPCPPELKCLDAGDFRRAWGGIASLQLTLATTWTCLQRQGKNDFVSLSHWLSEAPAKLLGCERQKGRLARGFDADLVVWDPEASWQVRGHKLFHRHSLTPYEGACLTGRVHRTYVRGNLVYRDGGFADRPSGKLLRVVRTWPW